MKKRDAAKRELETLRQYGLPPEGACVLEFEADEELFRQGEKIDWFMFVLKGTGDVQLHAPNGGKLSFGYSISEGALGEMELLSGKNVSNTTVIALTPLVCLAIPFETAAREMQKNIVFSNAMGKKVALACSSLQANYLMITLAGGEQRLAAYILRKSRNGVFRDTLSDTASVIGVSYRHIFRMLGRLCDDGILSKQKDGYHITDAERLKTRSAV